MTNLRRLAVAATSYADDHAGAFPDSLDALLAAGYLGQNPVAVAPTCVCPACNDTPAGGANLQQMLQAMNSKPRPENYPVTTPRPPGHVSYIYAARGMTKRTLRINTVLFYEPYTNGHKQNGAPAICAVFADGHCELIPKSKADPMIAAIQSRVLPLPPPATKVSP
jgi:hypothetical protein